MKKLLFFVILLVTGFHSVHAQSVSSVQSQLRDTSFSMGREFWFAEQSNYWGQNIGNKYLRLYITSPQNTTAFIESQGTTTQLSITANKISTFLIPEYWEMESSGIVENKAIHIYSKDAGLSICSMSHNNYTTDGEYLVPAIGWDTKYVVAAYGSLFEGGGSYIYDLPSTCAIVANQDNTQVDITPSCDCRQCTGGTASGNANSSIVVFPAGQTFTITMNRGESFQLMPVKCTGPDGFDMTGTVIHSNNNVGVLGGSVCPNIPANFPYCDHVEEMMPSLRTWGTTYITNSFHEPPGQDSLHNFAAYLFISSQPNQTIYRSNCDGSHTECVIPSQYGIVWDDLQGAQKFWSDAPFLCVEYINSATYPDGTNGDGDPAEADVIPVDQFVNTVVFETPDANAYHNYANVAVNVQDVQKTTFDGKPIRALGTEQCVDENWVVYSLSDLSAGSHIVTGDDSGVGVYVYGYGYDESYAWSATSFEGTHQTGGTRHDTVPPAAIVAADCQTAHVSFSNGSSEKLAALWIDSMSNISYKPDPAWVEGIPVTSGYFDCAALNPGVPYFVRATAYDFAGNSTTVTISSVSPLSESAPLFNFGTLPIGSARLSFYDTLTNASGETIPVDSIYLLNGVSGFEIDSAITQAMLPGSRRVIKLSYSPTAAGPQADTIIIGIGSSCNKQDILLSGSGASAASVDPSLTRTTASVQTSDGRTIAVLLPASWSGPVQVELDNDAGVAVYTGTITGTSFDAGTLPRGIYFWRLTCNKRAQSGKILLGQ